MICLHHISKSFAPRITAVDNISFSIERGEWVFATGPSGAGKTTLLNLIFGTLPPSRGSVEVAGVDLARAGDARLRQLRRQIGFVFQNSRLIEQMTVFENIALPLHIRGFSDSMVEKLVFHTMEQLNIQDMAEVQANALSGGEKQKVAFARAFVTKPPIVLADEPTGNLDARSGMLIMEMFRRIHMQGTTVLIATHDEDWLRRYSKRCLILEKGRLVKDQPYGARI